MNAKERKEATDKISKWLRCHHPHFEHIRSDKENRAEKSLDRAYKFSLAVLWGTAILVGILHYFY